MTAAPGPTQADSPTELRRRDLKRAAVEVWTAISHDKLSLIAAGIAFFGLLALFPAITALMAIAGLFLTPDDVTAQITQVSQMMPQSAAEIVIGQAQSVAGSDQGGLGIAATLGIVIALYSASAGVSNLIQGLNVCYGTRETRNFIKLKAVTMVMTLLMILGLIIALAVVLVLPGVLAVVNLGGAIEATVSILRWIILLGLTVGGIGLIYHFGPDRKPSRWRWMTPGALIACFLWVAASFGFSLYAENFGSYQETFGSLAGVVILLFWLWISAFIVLLGARINAALEQRTSADTQA